MRVCHHFREPSALESECFCKSCSVKDINILFLFLYYFFPRVIITFFCTSPESSWLIVRKVSEANGGHLIQDLGPLMLFSSAWYLTLEAEGLKRLREGSLSCVWMSNTSETAIKCSVDYFQRICLVRDDAVKVTRLPRKCWWLIKGKAGSWTRVTQETGALMDVKSLCRHWDN